MSDKYAGMFINAASLSDESLRVVSHDEPEEYMVDGQLFVRLKKAVCTDGQTWDLTFPVSRATLTGVTP